MAFRIISNRLTSICNSFTQPPLLPLSPCPRRYLFTNSSSVYFAKNKVDEVKKPKCPDFEQYFTKTKKVEEIKSDETHLDRKDEQYIAKARKVEVIKNDEMRLDKKEDTVKSPIQPPNFGDKPMSAQRRVLAEKKTTQKLNLFPIKGPSTTIEKTDTITPIKKEKEATTSIPSPETTKPPVTTSQTSDKRNSLTKSLNDFTQFKLPLRSLDTKNISTKTDLKKENNPPEQLNTIDDVKTKSQSSVPITNSDDTSKSKKNLNYVWLAAVGLFAIGSALLMKKPNSTNPSENVTENQVVNKNTENKEIKSPAELPKKVPYLIIGGGTASWSAFKAIKDHVPNAKVLVVSNETYQPYMRPPLSKVLWSTGNDCKSNLEEAERKIYFEASDFYSDPMNLLNDANGGISLLSNRTAKYLKLCERKVVLSDGSEIEYDECLLATGTKPRNLLIFQTAPLRIRNKISFCRSINDFQSVKDIADKSESVAVIGGGFLASDISLALTVYGGKKLKVYQIFHENGNMGMTLPRYLSDWIRTKLTDYGLSIIPNTQVDSVHMENSKLKLGLLSGQLVVVDHVIVALGSQPDVAFAKMSGLNLCQNCGIAVNENLEALPHLYVAGDAACPPGYFGKETDASYDHAIATGRLAGENMAGKKKPFTHQSMFSSSVAPEISFESVGLIDARLKTVGLFSDGANVSTNIDNTNKGVVFYIKNDKVVGIVLWNIFDKINIARQVIAEGRELYDLKEVAKRFEIHG